MRFARVLLGVVVCVAVAAPVALAFGFDDGVKPSRGIVGEPYSFQFKGRNGCPPYTYVFQSGSLPSGLSMSSEGTIAGMPTTVGRYSFWLELRDSGCTGGTCPPAGSSCSFPSQRPFTIDIVAPLSVRAPSLTVGEKGVPVTPTSVRVSGGRGPYKWAVVRAPDWLILSDRGVIGGTPDVPGSFRLTLTTTDLYGDTATVDATLTVKAKLAVTTTQLSAVKVGRNYRQPLHTNGGVAPFRWKVASVRFPSGVLLDTQTGVVNGVPKKAGRYILALMVKDALGMTSLKRLSLTIVAEKPARTGGVAPAAS